MREIGNINIVLGHLSALEATSEGLRDEEALFSISHKSSIQNFGDVV